MAYDDDVRHRGSAPLKTGAKLTLIIIAAGSSALTLVVVPLAILGLAFGFDAPGSGWTFDLILIMLLPLFLPSLAAASFWGIKSNQLHPPLVVGFLFLFSLLAAALLVPV